MTSTRRAWAAAAAVVPGVAVHGSGHFVLGESQTGWRLLGAQAAGLGLTVSSIGGLAATGAAPQLVRIFIWGAGAGVGLLVFPMLADLYGVLAPEGGVGEPLLEVPRLSISTGYRNVDNPVFDYRHLSRTQLELAWGPAALRPVYWHALDGDNTRLEVPVTARILGPTTSAATDGSFLEAELGYSQHRHGADAFTEHLVHGVGRARLDLHHVGPTLRGSFVEGGLGYAAGFVTYDGLPGDETSLTLAELAWGFYLADRPGFGEFALYYSHRHDGYSAGLKSVGVGSGAIGHFGARVERSVYGDLGVQADVEVGAAVVAGASLVYRVGASQ